MYIYCLPPLDALIRLWDSEVQVGDDVKKVIKSIMERGRLILISPWEILQENQELVIQIRAYISENPHLCVIFGGNGEIDLFGEEKVNTRIFNREQYLGIKARHVN